MILPLISSAERVIYVEEGIKNGGFSMICSALLREKYGIGADIAISIRAIDASFGVPEERCNLYEYLGFAPHQLASEIKSLKSSVKIRK